LILMVKNNKFEMTRLGAKASDVWGIASLPALKHGAINCIFSIFSYAVFLLPYKPHASY
jgi:hypothetical protein